MVVVKIGGPAYRIGMGGGAASSVPSGGREGGNAADLDFNAVQVMGSITTTMDLHVQRLQAPVLTVVSAARLRDCTVANSSCTRHTSWQP